MEFLPGAIGFVSDEAIITTSEVITDFFKNENGLIGYKNPTVGVGNKESVPAFVIIHERAGILLVEVLTEKVISTEKDGEYWKLEKGQTVYSKDIVLDKFYSEIENRLKSDLKFFDRRSNSVKINISKVLYITGQPKETLKEFIDKGIIINQVCDDKDFGNFLNTFNSNNSVDPSLIDPLYALLEGTKAYEKPSIEIPDGTEKTLSGFSSVSLIHTFKLDKKQRKVSMQLPQGPQRIRGLAGTGKTVILALKAALTHKEFKDYKILFVFNTQSMYNQIRNLISKYYIYEKRKEPNWENLEVLHAWGGSSQPGLYSKTCDLFGFTPFKFMQVRNQKDPYEYIFSDLLEKIKKIEFEPIYDMVLIDEAQDFTPSFFELMYLLTKKPKRIIWAYDEFQSLNELRIKEPEDLFGKDKNGTPNMKNTELDGVYVGGIEKDFILENSYRNPRMALMIAHGLGLGLYRKEGIIDVLSDKKTWSSLGYDVLQPNKDLFVENDKLIITRPEKNSRNTLEKILKENGIAESELLKEAFFENSIHEYDSVAKEITRLIIKEKFSPEQIIVISLANANTKEIFIRLRQMLEKEKIKSITPGFVEASSSFQEKGYVTLTTPFRAKGNEADVVFVIDAQNVISKYSFRGRNAIFVSITRSRGWTYISGSGPNTQALQDEIQKIKTDYPQFKFTFPSEEDIMRRRIVLSKSSDEYERSGLQLDKLISENPELLLEILKNRPDLMSQIKKQNE